MTAHVTLDGESCQEKSKRTLDPSMNLVINRGRTIGSLTGRLGLINSGGPMKKQYAFVFVVSLVAFLLSLNGNAQGNAPLKLVQTIPLPGVQGRMHHITVDVPDKRLFVPANGDSQNSVEVIDLRAGKWISSIPGQSKPQ